MATKTWLETRDAPPRKLALTLPFEGAVTATCSEPCACGSASVVGDGRERSIAHPNRYIARGFCAGCRARRGTIHAEVATLFGLEEDERVLAGPWKVY